MGCRSRPRGGPGRSPGASPTSPSTSSSSIAKARRWSTSRENMRCEIVIFGKNQKLLTPRRPGLGGDRCSSTPRMATPWSRSARSPRGTMDGRSKVESPLDLQEVVREMANLGASYPEIVAVMASASTQKNLPGPFVVRCRPPGEQGLRRSPAPFRDPQEGRRPQEDERRIFPELVPRPDEGPLMNR